MRSKLQTAKRRRFLVLGFALLLLAAGGCGRVSVNRETPAPAGASNAPKRIISLSPNTTEILYGVGAFDRVVAVSTFCDYPPGVEKLPRVATWQSTNLEQMQSLDPDLIVMIDAQAPFSKHHFDALGIPTLVVNSQTLDDTISAIRQIGHATGNDAEGEALAARTEATIDAVRARAKDLPRPRVLCVVDRVPGTLRDLYTATKGSFLYELIEAAGGEPVAPPAETGYGKISKEAVAELNPDIIIDMIQGQKGAYSEDPQAVWRELPELKAVAEGRVFPIRETSVLHPSQFVADSAERFARVIHPEVFGRDEPAKP